MRRTVLFGLLAPVVQVAHADITYLISGTITQTYPAGGFSSPLDGLIPEGTAWSLNFTFPPTGMGDEPSEGFASWDFGFADGRTLSIGQFSSPFGDLGTVTLRNDLPHTVYGMVDRIVLRARSFDFNDVIISLDFSAGAFDTLRLPGVGFDASSLLGGAFSGDTDSVTVNSLDGVVERFAVIPAPGGSLVLAMAALPRLASRRRLTADR